jgi:hypothetical protein
VFGELAFKTPQLSNGDAPINCDTNSDYSISCHESFDRSGGGTHVSHVLSYCASSDSQLS